MSLQSFLTRLIWLCVLPLTALAAIMALHFLRHLDTEREQAAATLLQDFVVATDHELNLRVAALQALALSHAVDQAPPWTDLYRDALTFRQHFGGQVVLVDADLNLLFTTRMPMDGMPRPLQRPQGKFAAQQALLTARPAVGDTVHGQQSGEILIAIAVPVLRQGRVGHVLAATIPTRDLQTRLDAVSLRPGWALALRDGVGTTIASRGPPLGGDGPAHRSSTRSTASPWTADLEIPDADYRAPLLEAASIMGVGFATALALALWAAQRASRRLGEAVRGLAAPVDAAPPGLEIVEIQAARRALDDAALRREQATRALDQSEARLRRLLALLPEAVLVGSGTRISYANRAAQQLLGEDEAGLLERAPQAIFEAASLVLQPERLRQLQAATEGVPLAQERVRRRDGQWREVETAVTLVDDADGGSVLVVMRDTTELRQMQATLRASHEDLQRLLDAQDQVQQDERQRIARELHDDLQQTLAAIRMDLSSVQARMAVDTAGASALLAKVDALAATAIASTRRIVGDLRPRLLEDLGLLAALDAMVQQFGQRAGLDCRFEAGPGLADDSPQARIAPAVATCLYRVVQEGLNNVGKHADATLVRVRLDIAEGGRLCLRVSDDGRGIDPADLHRPRAFGLLGMRERVRAVGGGLRIDSEPGSGTTLEVRVPMLDSAAALPPGAGSAPPAPAAGPAATPADEVQQQLIDALAGHVAVLDADGRIVRVNQAWCKFADRNGDAGARRSGPGADYLQVCRQGAKTDSAVQHVLNGLLGVLGGSQPVYMSDYPCPGPDGPRWYRLHASPLVRGGALVTHFEITPPAPPA